MPSGAVTADSVSVALISMAETSCVIVSGMSPGQRLDVDLARLLGEHAALIDAGGVVGAESSSTTVVWIVSFMFTRRKSTCMMSPRTGWRCRSLTSTGEARAAVDADVEDRAGVGKRVAQDARVDGEVRRLAVAAVDDARHLTRAAQPPGGARALGIAGVERKLRGVGHDLGGRRGQGKSTRRAAEHGSECGAAHAGSPPAGVGIH